MDKPEALRLEDVPRIMDNANAELRRLSAVEAQRDALLEVVRKFVAWSEAERDHSGTTFWQRVEMCREVDALAHAAIKAAEEAK